MEPRFKKVSDTKVEGTGESVLKGGCCQCMFHDLGDEAEIKEDGKFWMKAGKSPAYPPCMQGKTVGYMKQLTMPGGSPSATEMQR